MNVPSGKVWQPTGACPATVPLSHWGSCSPAASVAAWAQRSRARCWPADRSCHIRSKRSRQSAYAADALEPLAQAPPDEPLRRSVESLTPVLVDVAPDVVFNVNTPADLAEAERRLRSR
jgi:CTP:molybdopterin cytidylyltransferase MocA